MILITAQRSPTWDFSQSLPYATLICPGLFDRDIDMYAKLSRDPLYVDYYGSSLPFINELTALERLQRAGIITGFTVEQYEGSFHNKPSIPILQMGAEKTAPVQLKTTSPDVFGRIDWHDVWYYAALFENGANFPIGFCARDCPGHETPQEACNHFAEYLSQSIQVNPGHDNETGGPCAVCGKLTHGYVTVRERQFYFHWYMCDFHRHSKRLYDRLYCRVTPEHGVEMWFRPITRYKTSYQEEIEKANPVFFFKGDE